MTAKVQNLFSKIIIELNFPPTPFKAISITGIWIIGGLLYYVENTIGIFCTELFLFHFILLVMFYVNQHILFTF